MRKTILEAVVGSTVHGTAVQDRLLGLQGEELLLTGRISLPMPDADRALTVKVRTGGFSLAEVSQQIVAVQRRLDTAHAGSPLREMPDSRKVEQWMIETHLAHWTTPDAA